MRLALAQALESRYTTISIYLAIATVVLVFVARRPRLTAAVVAAVVAAQLLATRSEWPHMVLFHRERLTGRAAADFALVARDQTALRELVWADPAATSTFAALAAIGYADPLRSALVDPLDSGAPGFFGDFVGATPQAEAWGVYGWAFLPGPRPADAVLLTSLSAEGEHVIGVARYAWMVRPALAEVEPSLRNAGWQHVLTPDTVSVGATVGARAYDTRARRTYRLAGSFPTSAPSPPP